MAKKREEKRRKSNKIKEKKRKKKKIREEKRREEKRRDKKRREARHAFKEMISQTKPQLLSSFAWPYAVGAFWKHMPVILESLVIIAFRR